ncbi:YceI family protein [Thermogemmatispora sp.]|uniref:YceI family protein n=1 Tax=Thermogemmatispora sp. TaxID=1968838 RepID=UPI0035E45AC9
MTWQIDPAHSRVAFAVRHMMVSTARGAFKVFSGEIEYDEQNPANSKITAQADAASIDTGQPDRDQHLRSADFFEVEKYPTITFVSTKIEPLGGNEYRVTGDLTMHGVTRPVTFTGEFNGPIVDAFGLRRAGILATATISRKDFGLTWNRAIESGGVIVDDKVKIEIELEITEKVPAASNA